MASIPSFPLCFSPGMAQGQVKFSNMIDDDGKGVNVNKDGFIARMYSD